MNKFIRHISQILQKLSVKNSVELAQEVKITQATDEPQNLIRQTLKYQRYLSVIIILVILDQLSKTYLITHLKTKPNFVLEILPFLDFVYAWNYGISFGLFRQYYQYSNYVLLILNLGIITYLIRLLMQMKSRLGFYALELIIGGAIGNIIDRILRGAVFDFIYFNYQGIDFPAFNLADSFISIGAALFIYGFFLKKL